MQEAKINQFTNEFRDLLQKYGVSTQGEVILVLATVNGLIARQFDELTGNINTLHGIVEFAKEIYDSAIVEPPKS